MAHVLGRDSWQINYCMLLPGTGSHTRTANVWLGLQPTKHTPHKPGRYNPCAAKRTNHAFSCRFSFYFLTHDAEEIISIHSRLTEGARCRAETRRLHLHKRGSPFRPVERHVLRTARLIYSLRCQRPNTHVLGPDGALRH